MILSVQKENEQSILIGSQKKQDWLKYKNMLNHSNNKNGNEMKVSTTLLSLEASWLI